MRIAIFAFVLIGGHVAAHSQPVPSAGDPGLQTAVYDPSQTLQLLVGIGAQLTVELNSDETVQTAVIGARTGWKVTSDARGSSILLNADASARPTSLSVVTTKRTYTFQLAPGSAQLGTAPYRLRFIYPGPNPALLPAPPPLASVSGALTPYRLSGSRALQPARVTDDSYKTYVEWEPDRLLPATFAIDETGQEVLVDGYMRAGRYVIDTVYKRLVFRLDRGAAFATRVARDGNAAKR